MQCKLPGCKKVASETWQKVDVCIHCFDKIQAETQKYYAKRLKSSERVLYKQIQDIKGGLEMTRLILQGTAPSVNHMYKNAVQGKRRMRVMTDVAQAWYDETFLRANHWRLRNKWSTASDKVIVRLWFFFPDKRRRDTHNALKALLDALEDAKIYEDDKNALPRIMDWEIDRENPRIEIEFERVV